MSRRLILSILFVIALIFMVSCSGGDGNMIASPPTDRDTVATPTSGATTCFGLWQISLDPATGTGDIVQLRSADLIINVLGFMEPPALTLMDLDWPNLVIDIPPGTAKVGVILRHPIAGDAVFNGFDVRGVCFGPKVANADGLTIIPSPEFFSGVPFGYKDGLLGAPDSFGNYEGLAGYKYYADDLDADDNLATFFNDTGNLANRGMFSSGETNQRDYELDWNGTGYAILVFNYAIYANYDWPVGDPPIDIDSFEITSANSAEAFCADFTELANSLNYSTGGGGGSISLQVELWDWQGDITDVTIESLEPGIMTQAGYDVALGAFPGGKSYGFEFYAVPATPTAVGDLDLLITVTDAKTFGEYWFLDLLDAGHDMYNEKIYNCFIYTTSVADCPAPEVTSITPTGGLEGALVNDATITGTFIDGTALAVNLTRTGETDIVCTDATFVDASSITCDIPLDDAALGLWDVEVINGCGTPGTGTGLFTVHISKNIDITNGTNIARDVAIDHSTGDILAYYFGGYVRRWTLSSFYTSYNQYNCINHPNAFYMDANHNGNFCISWVTGTSTSLLYRIYSPSGVQQMSSSHGVWYTYQAPMDVAGFPNAGTYAGAFHVFGYGAYENYVGHHGVGRTYPSWGAFFNYPPYCYSPFSYSLSNIYGPRVRGNEVNAAGDAWWWLEAGECVAAKYAVASSTPYQNSFFGALGVADNADNRLFDPLDITRDSSDAYYILDHLSTGAYVIKGFTIAGITTNALTSFGTADMDYTPIRMDGSDYDDSVTVLMIDSTDTYVSIFGADETPEPE